MQGLYKAGEGKLRFVSLSFCLYLFCPAEIYAYLTQREPEEGGQNNCKRSSLGLFDTYQVSESSSKSLPATSAASQGGELHTAIAYV